MELKNSVLVVGGGNTAIDCARTALRAGSRDVTIIYRRSRAEMPANAEEIDEAEIEGVKLDLLALPVKIEVEENGVKKVTCQKMQLGEPDESGRRRPVPVPGSEYVINCDMILSAIGEKPDVSFLNNKVELTDWGTIKVDKNGATSMKGVFAAGDCVNGPASIVEAMASGKRAAIGAVMYLDGKTTVSNEKEEVFEPFHKEFLKHNLDNTYNYARERQHARMIDRNVLLDNFNEVEQVLTKKQAVQEADRCLKCYKVILVTRN
jgi:formate dehydrogenase beta subunit